MTVKDQNYLSLNRLPVLLRGAWFGLNRVFRKRLCELGITTTQYTALRCLHENKGLNQNSLANLMSTNKNNSSALIKRLYAQGLILKEAIPSDRRNFTLNLTEKGKVTFLQAEKIASNLQREVMGVLPDNSEPRFISILEKCTESISGLE